MDYAVKNVLWATDFSAEANNALLYAKLFAGAYKAKLSAVYIFPELQTSLLEARPMILDKGRVRVAGPLAEVTKGGTISLRDIFYGAVGETVEDGTSGEQGRDG